MANNFPMNHNSQPENDANLGTTRSMTRNQSDNNVPLSKSSSKQVVSWARHDNGTGSTSTLVADDVFDEKNAKTVHAAAVDQAPNPSNRAEAPQLIRAVSYGAAAPYVPVDISIFSLSEALSRVASTLPGAELSNKGEDQLSPVSRVSTDAHGNTYPEGGKQAWLCVLGSFCGMMGALGVMNTLGTIQSYVSQHQLQNYSESTIGWIFSIYTFLGFFCGIQIGPLFDAKGPRWLIAPGSIMILITWFMLGFCTRYWHFIVVFSLVGGIGTSLVFTPSVAVIGHYFLRKRGLCTGLAAVGGSMGGVVFPLVLQTLYTKVGFAWATRVIGFISIGLFIIANLFIKARLPPRPATKEAILPDLRIFRDRIYALTTMGIFFIEWALFIPLAYLTSYALSHGIDAQLSYQMVAFLNVGSCFGRWMPGLIADKAGRFNTMLITLILSVLTTFAIWLPAGSNVGAIIAYAVIFGFASGSGISLTPVCVSQLCKVENYGRYYATCYTVVSFACLTGLPFAGFLISACDGSYWGVILFTGISYSAAVTCFGTARVLGAGWSLRKAF